MQWWRRYHARRPIDDESNHQVPAAQIAAIYVNAHRAENSRPVGITDFLPFRPVVERKVEDELLAGNW
jgi:hypothetical protein